MQPRATDCRGSRLHRPMSLYPRNLKFGIWNLKLEFPRREQQKAGWPGSTSFTTAALYTGQAPKECNNYQAACF